MMTKEKPEYTDEELKQIDRALSDYIAPYLNPQIIGAEPDDEGIPEMESAWEKTIKYTRNE